jgi:hypothetical protein
MPTMPIGARHRRPESQEVAAPSCIPLVQSGLFRLRRDLRLKDGPGSQERHAQCLAEVGGSILSPSARTGPSRPGPAAEGRSDSGVLHLHPPGRARYPEGGRWREDEPLGRGGALAPVQGMTSTRATSPGCSAGCGSPRAVRSRQDQLRTSVQAAPIRTAAPRAANAVGGMPLRCPRTTLNSR